jgi:hypothetical protein
VGCLPNCVVVLTLEANNDNLYNYTVLTWGVPERTGKMWLRRYIDDSRQQEMIWVHRLALGTWEGTSTGTLFVKGFKLVLLTSWVSLLNKLTLSVVWWTLYSEGRILHCIGYRGRLFLGWLCSGWQTLRGAHRYFSMNWVPLGYGVVIPYISTNAPVHAGRSRFH